MADGYMGKYLRVDLTRLKTRDEKLDTELTRKYIGGAGIGIRLLYDEVRPGADPLGPENRLIFFTGPFQGTLVPTSGRFHVTTKSPLTGFIGDANSGGHFGAYIKYAGYDGIVVQGRASKPVYLLIDDGSAELRDAGNLWGKDTFDTDRQLKEELHDGDVAICSIGQAGENLVRISCVMNDLDRTPGRTGNGAVMGSKNLKAIALRGDFSVEVSDAEGLHEIVADLLRRHAESSADPLFNRLRDYGTVDSVSGCNDLGNLPTRNWVRNEFQEGAEDISGESVRSKLSGKSQACFNCPIGCGRFVKIPSKEGKLGHSGGPEYESTAALGSLCMNHNVESIAYANLLCNLYGMDTISVGNTVAFAMECYEKGILTKDEMNGLDLTWGNSEAEIKLIEMIALRQGIGRILADGVKRASERIGRGSEVFAVHVKGLELPMHEPRGAPGLALGYATSTRGACHLRTLSHGWEIWGQSYSLGLPKAVDRFVVEGKSSALILFQDLMSIMNSLVYCIFATAAIPNLTLQDWTGMLNATTGWNTSTEEAMTIGERIWNLQRLYNMREGASRRDDTLPERIRRHAVPFPDGKRRVASDLAPMLDEYYELRGWDREGRPTERRLEKLGLSASL